ncbi:hypothetical protein RUM44_001143 [Polyplax serrata]|uniref:Uncharacterized protein n=1 Tax=Polyplax serrata TaxID=468196 RepID=A0ABR1B9L4_POLSC
MAGDKKDNTRKEASRNFLRSVSRRKPTVPCRQQEDKATLQSSECLPGREKNRDGCLYPYLKVQVDESGVTRGKRDVGSLTVLEVTQTHTHRHKLKSYSLLALTDGQSWDT